MPNLYCLDKTTPAFSPHMSPHMNELLSTPVESFSHHKKKIIKRPLSYPSHLTAKTTIFFTFCLHDLHRYSL
jgi:hypothetical protein